MDFNEYRKRGKLTLSIGEVIASVDSVEVSSADPEQMALRSDRASRSVKASSSGLSSPLAYFDRGETYSRLSSVSHCEGCDIRDVSKRALQWCSKCYCVASVTETFTLKSVQTVHRLTTWTFVRL
jgi:hypothetical protein